MPVRPQTRRTIRLLTESRDLTSFESFLSKFHDTYFPANPPDADTFKKNRLVILGILLLSLVYNKEDPGRLHGMIKMALRYDNHTPIDHVTKITGRQGETISVALAVFIGLHRLDKQRNTDFTN